MYTAVGILLLTVADACSHIRVLLWRRILPREFAGKHQCGPAASSIGLHLGICFTSSTQVTLLMTTTTTIFTKMNLVGRWRPFQRFLARKSQPESI